MSLEATDSVISSRGCVSCHSNQVLFLFCFSFCSHLSLEDVCVTKWKQSRKGVNFTFFIWHCFVLFALALIQLEVIGWDKYQAKTISAHCFFSSEAALFKLSSVLTNKIQSYRNKFNSLFVPSCWVVDVVSCIYVFRLAGGVVIFNYRDYNNKLRKTEGTLIFSSLVPQKRFIFLVIEVLNLFFCVGVVIYWCFILLLNCFIYAQLSSLNWISLCCYPSFSYAFFTNNWCYRRANSLIILNFKVLIWLVDPSTIRLMFLLLIGSPLLLVVHVSIWWFHALT